MKTLKVLLLKRYLLTLLIILIISSIILSVTGCAQEEKSKLFVFCNDALYSLSINEQMQIEKTKITDPIVEIDKKTKTKFFCLGAEAPFLFPTPPFTSIDGEKMIIRCSIEKDRKESPLSCLETPPFYAMVNTDGSEKRLLLFQPPKVEEDNGYKFWGSPWFSVSEKKYYYIIVKEKFSEGGKITEHETQLWKANFDGSDRKNLLKEKGVFYYPEQYYAYWEFGSFIESPDGENILFFFAKDPFSHYVEYLNLWLMNINTGEKRNLTEEIRKYLDDKEACIFETLFSPDGKKIIMFIGYTNKMGIWSMNIDGSDKKNLTENLENKELLYPFFLISSDSKILFLKELKNEDNNGNNYSGPDLDIWIMNLDGTNIKNLTEKGPKCRFPLGRYESYIPGYKFQNIPALPPGFIKFSPDSKKIVFKGKDKNGYSLWIMNSDDSEKKTLVKKLRINLSKNSLKKIKNGL